MAVEEPVTSIVRFKLDGAFPHGRYIHGVFEGGTLALAIDEAEKMTVKVDRMVHHGVIDQMESKHLAFFYSDGGFLRQGLVIE